MNDTSYYMTWQVVFGFLRFMFITFAPWLNAYLAQCNRNYQATFMSTWPSRVASASTSLSVTKTNPARLEKAHNCYPASCESLGDRRKWNKTRPTGTKRKRCQNKVKKMVWLQVSTTAKQTLKRAAIRCFRFLVQRPLSLAVDWTPKWGIPSFPSLRRYRLVVILP